MTDRRAYLTAKKREERARHYAAGRQSVTVWVYPEDREAVREYAQKLAAWRESLDAAKARNEKGD